MAPRSAQQLAVCLKPRERRPQLSRARRGGGQSGAGATMRGAGATARRRMSLLSAAVAALVGADPLVESLAARPNALTTAGAKLEIVMRTGEEQAEYLFGWRGISADWVAADQRDLPRFDVRVVCSERCPPDLLRTEVAEDTVMWKTGRYTRGYIEVSCDEQQRCVVRQNGLSRPWDDVRYVLLRPSLGGCFARLDGDRSIWPRLGS